MTHKEHLEKWNYELKKNECDFDKEQTEARWKELTDKYGEDNVWDYRILSDAFETNECCFTFGMMFGAVKRETGEEGALSQTGTILGEPRFYYDFR